MANRDPRILLAIDYGTTFTGVAWAQQANGSSKIHYGLRVLPEWPDAREERKVPSQISYAATSSGKKQWGFSIEPGSNVFGWTKMELMPQSPAKELLVLCRLLEGQKLIQDLHSVDRFPLAVPRHLIKDAGEVIEDFLSRVARQWHSYMTKEGNVALEEIVLDVIVTFPASWNYGAKNATVRAVRGALKEGMFPHVRDFYVVSEPEACALFSVQDMLAKQHNILFRGECFVIVDAGGGTVDVGTYRVQSLDPLRLTQVGTIDGKNCGSTFVDKAFLEWLEPKLVGVSLVSQNMDSGGHSAFAPLSINLVEQFEVIKHKFDAEESNSFDLPPNYTDSKGKTRDINPAPGYEDNIIDGVVTLSRKDIQGLFDPHVKKIIQMIAGQVASVEIGRHGGDRLSVTNIFLSGGFSKNPYLRKVIRRYANTQSPQINVHPLKDIDDDDDYDCLTAVVQGALLKGMGIGSELATKVTICPKHYGVVLSEPYKEWKGGVAIKGKFHQREIVPGQLTWLVKKGDIIMPDSPIIASTRFQGHVSSAQYTRGSALRVTFVACDQPEPPMNISEMNEDKYELKDLLIDLKEIPEKELLKQKNANGFRHYLTADLIAEIAVSDSATYTIKHGSRIMRTYSTSSERKAKNHTVSASA